MKKITLSIILLTLVACATPTPSSTAMPTSAISSCAPQELGKYSSFIMPIFNRWGTAVQKAYSVKPTELSTEITNLQTIDAEFKGIFPPACLVELHKALLSTSDYMIKGFTSIYSGDAEAKIADYFARANSMLAITVKELKAITTKTQ